MVNAGSLREKWQLRSWLKLRLRWWYNGGEGQRLNNKEIDYSYWWLHDVIKRIQQIQGVYCIL